MRISILKRRDSKPLCIMPPKCQLFIVIISIVIRIIYTRFVNGGIYGAAKYRAFCQVNDRILCVGLLINILTQKNSRKYILNMHSGCEYSSVLCI